MNGRTSTHRYVQRTWKIGSENDTETDNRKEIGAFLIWSNTIIIFYTTERYNIGTDLIMCRRARLVKAPIDFYGTFKNHLSHLEFTDSGSSTSRKTMQSTSVASQRDEGAPNNYTILWARLRTRHSSSTCVQCNQRTRAMRNKRDHFHVMNQRMNYVKTKRIGHCKIEPKLTT